MFINFVFLYSDRPLNNVAHHSFLVRTVDESQILIILIAE
jgi:hypothetical protein